MDNFHATYGGLARRLACNCRKLKRLAKERGALYWKRVKRRVLMQPIYRITRKELDDTMKACYKAGLSDSQILELFQYPPYKWNTVIYNLSEENRMALEPELFDTPDPVEQFTPVEPQDTSYLSPTYADTYADNYGSYNSGYSDSYSNSYDGGYNIYDNDVNRNFDALVREQSVAKSTSAERTPAEKAPETGDIMRGFVQQMMDKYCGSSEFAKKFCAALCAEYPQYAALITAYIENTELSIAFAPTADKRQTANKKAATLHLSAKN